MEPAQLLNPDQWAEQTFGQVQLRDRRRTKRVVSAACRMVRDPTASLPKQQQSWKALKASYRLLDEEDVTFEALIHPHWHQTVHAYNRRHWCSWWRIRRRSTCPIIPDDRPGADRLTRKGRRFLFPSSSSEQRVPSLPTSSGIEAALEEITAIRRTRELAWKQAGASGQGLTACTERS